MFCVAAADFTSKTAKCKHDYIEFFGWSARRREDAPALPSNPFDAASFHAIVRDRVEKIILLSFL